MRETVPRCVMLPEVPVTVMVYVPGVVPGFPPPPPPLLLPPQPGAPPTTQKSRTSIPSTLHHFRLRAGMLTAKMQARAVPPIHGSTNLPVRLRAPLGPVVFTVRAIVCAVVPLMVTEAGTLQVAGSLAAWGVIAQLRLITPVNPFEGVKLKVEVFPAGAPGVTLTAVPVMENEGRSMI